MSETSSTSNQVGNIIGLLLAAVILAIFIWRLPVNGSGSLLWYALMTGMAIIRIPHERQSKSVTTRRSRQDKIENILLFGVTLGSAILPVLHLTTGLLDFANYRTSPAWPFAGLLLMIPGLWLFRRSHVDLGRNWSVTLEIREQHGLITNGVYRRIRHPMYSAIFLLYGAQAVFIQNWIAGFSGLAAFALMYFVRIPTEEAMMREQFGEAYEHYSDTTGRLVPRMGN
ncbi:MAG: protein-S-isoprenylcysteine O-methyltransferase [Pseudomonadota bacterium]